MNVNRGVFWGIQLKMNLAFFLDFVTAFSASLLIPVHIFGAEDDLTENLMVNAQEVL